MGRAALAARGTGACAFVVFPSSNAPRICCCRFPAAVCSPARVEISHPHCPGPVLRSPAQADAWLLIFNLPVRSGKDNSAVTLPVGPSAFDHKQPHGTPDARLTLCPGKHSDPPGAMQRHLNQRVQLCYMAPRADTAIAADSPMPVLTCRAR